MKQIISISIFLFILLGVSVYAMPALAAPCNTSGTGSTNEAICNPAPNFFVDLTKPNIGQTNTFAGLISFIIIQTLKVVGVLAVGFIIFGGLQYLTSGGNEEQAEAGKKTLTNAVIGLVIIILSYVIVAVVVNALFAK